MMDNVIGQLFTLPNLILCLMIWILVWVQRKVVEQAWKGAKTNKLWNHLFLPLGPLGTGAAIGATLSQYPYPEDFNSFWARIFFCVVCGLVSSHAYKILKKFLRQEEGEDSSNDGEDDPVDILDDK